MLFYDMIVLNGYLFLNASWWAGTCWKPNATAPITMWLKPFIYIPFPGPSASTP
jgi:hypothetical protein